MWSEHLSVLPIKSFRSTTLRWSTVEGVEQPAQVEVWPIACPNNQATMAYTQHFSKLQQHNRVPSSGRPPPIPTEGLPLVDGRWPNRVDDRRQSARDKISGLICRRRGRCDRLC